MTTPTTITRVPPLPTTELDPTDVRCPLLVLTYNILDDYEQRRLVIDRCGETLFLTTEQSTDLEDVTVTGSDWKVECTAGHVLLIPNHYDDDPPIDLALLHHALRAIAYNDPIDYVDAKHR
jgi:hypothetical protein